MHEIIAKYRRLDSQKIVETVQMLQVRVEERFPGSGLSRLVAELLGVSQETIARTAWIQKPHLPLRAAAVVLSIGIVVCSVSSAFKYRAFGRSGRTYEFCLLHRMDRRLLKVLLS